MIGSAELKNADNMIDSKFAVSKSCILAFLAALGDQILLLDDKLWLKFCPIYPDNSCWYANYGCVCWDVF